MSLRFSYIGDPLSALGFALIGAQRFAPERSASAVAHALDEARNDSDLVLIENAYAALIDEHLRTTIIGEPVPPVVVVPCLYEDDELSDASVREARAVLSIG
ncbi:MAG: V-type ATP synthase subunit F [Gammaproteobacteria bacterium]|nr:V-type ATP synthase subunit F [Gammaproteobacteria bacterium]